MHTRLAGAAVAVAVATAVAAALPAAPPSEGTVRVPGGAELRYVRQGRGPTLLVIGSSIYYPRVFSKNLSKSFDIVYADGRHFARGYQPTSEEASALTLDRFAEDVEAVREALKVPRIAVLGHSVHAQIAMRYARRHPDRTSHVILDCGVPYAPSEFARVVSEFWERDASPERKKLLERNREEARSALAAAPPARAFAIRQRADAPRFWANAAFDPGPLQEGLENNASMDRLFSVVPTRSDVRSTLESLKMPIFVAVGSFDYGVPHALWPELVAGLPNVTVHLFARSGHHPHVEQPEEFDQALNAWFKSSGR